MEELRQIEFAEKDLPLRQDVSLMGRLVGEVLVEQHGPELLERVESVRRAAIRMREGDTDAIAVLEAELDQLEFKTIEQILKAFSSYLRMANLAEKTHRIRRKRDYQRRHATAQRGSLEHVLTELSSEQVSADLMRESLARLAIRPVFTAHPTEATRRSFLEKEYFIIHRLVERLNPERTPEEEQQTIGRIRDAIGTLWQTRSVPGFKPTVADELDNVLFYLTEILYRIMPPLHESLEAAFQKAYGEPLDTDVSKLIRLGSWVGGDMDGNPNVNAKTLLQTLKTQRQAVIRCYRSELQRLAHNLSQTRGQTGFLPDIDIRLDQYSDRFPDLIAEIPRRHYEMPYRCLLQLMVARLDETQADLPDGYSTAAEFLSDVRLIGDSLESNRGRHAGLFNVRRLQRKIEIFGFHLATVDARQDSLVHRRVVGRLLKDSGWPMATAEKRSEKLAEILESKQFPEFEWAALDPESRTVLEMFRAIGECQKRFGKSAVGLFIISMTQGVDDVLSTMLLAHLAGVGESGALPLDVAPLLETVDDLDSGPSIIEELLNTPAYRRHLEQRDRRQVVMVGYSDSNKDSGIASARWSLYRAQKRLIKIASNHDTLIHFFHGRGGTVSRGGGNLVHGIEGAPPESINGYVQVTEQGEVINQKYGIRPLALRNLEIMAGAALRHELTDTGQKNSADEAALMDEIAQQSRKKFRHMVYETPGFIDYFRSATPIDVIERLSIGSRPASRRGGGGVENLRAIPWVFSWAQVRVGLPGVYGLGSALQNAIDQHGIESLRSMYNNWRFFRGLISDAEMVLAKSTLEIGERYASLAPSSAAGVFEQIRDEFDRATEAVLEIREIPQLLDDQHTLRRNIRLRNPYSDPIHLLQIDLLHRWRTDGRQEGDVLNALKSSVHGIALAIQNTG